MIRNNTLIALLCLLFQFAHAQSKKPKHIILIGVDGLGAYAFPGAGLPAINKQLSGDTITGIVKPGNVAPSKTPTLDKLMRDGAYSLEARSVLPSSSAVNWASMTMGAGPELHGYTEWGSQKPELPSRMLDQHNLFPSVFAVMREQRPQAEIGVIYEWDGIGYLLPKKALSREINCEGDSATALAAAAYITERKPDLLFVHFSDVDHVGHSTGHGTPAYYAQVDKTDTYIKKITDAVREAGISEETLILVSADHGGINKGHGGKTMQEMRIPWIASGAGIKRRGAIKESIVTYDTAATIAWLFNLKVPQVWTGRAVKGIFE